MGGRVSVACFWWVTGGVGISWFGAVMWWRGYGWDGDCLVWPRNAVGRLRVIFVLVLVGAVMQRDGYGRAGYLLTLGR